VSYAIEATGVEKAFIKKRSLRDLITRPLRRAERVEALRGIDLRVEQGEIFGLLGPNGAGKTTLLKILCCLILPDRGRAVVGGYDTREERRVKPQIGLVHSDERSFYWRLSGRENLRFFARLYEVPGRKIASRIDELLRRVDMLHAADRPFSGYSSGMKQRMAIARSLLHDPPILLMDEPTRSLDPDASLRLRHFIRDELWKRDGKTILLATHNLPEAQALACHMAIVAQGRVRRLGTVDEVRRWGVETEQFAIELSSFDAAVGGPFEVVSDTSEDGRRRLVLAKDRDVALNDVIAAFLGAGASVLSVNKLEPTLEDAFARTVSEDTDE